MILHKNLTQQKWQSLPFFNQMANVGAEVGRAINWREKDRQKSKSALERSIELLDNTIEDPKNKSRLKEICRLKEVLVDYFYDNRYGSNDERWNNYFYGFNHAAALKSGL